ncbi:ABC transporter substrate-binding protein [Phenylobacterium sp.]|uniref:ABC transporter substrate-binding protein n=1 Tax=Phenylobacterium sp. TaxID=1871053 RepID=UPI00301E2D94
MDGSQTPDAHVASPPRPTTGRRPPLRWPWIALAAATLVLVAALSHAIAPPPPAHPARTLRIAMTAGDLPTTTGAPSQGLEGVRFAGYPAFEPLVMWDLRVTDRPPGVIPWLAHAYESDPNDRNRWIFHLRTDVKFQDGTPFDADAVVWNFARLFDQSAPQFEAANGAAARSKAPMIDRWEKIDDHTVAIYTNTVTSFFPEIVAGVLMVSPTRWRDLKGDWQAFGQQPIGTGPFQITKVTRTSITMDRNPGYWNPARAAKLDRIVLYAMAEATTRIAALRSGEVDWIENPPPDAIPYLKASGYNVSLTPMAHAWPYWLRQNDGSPFRDIRVRQAINYAMDREGLVTLLNGAAEPARGYWKPSDPRFGAPRNHYRYDPDRARALLAEAGYPPDKLLKIRVLVAPTGSGQMLALPMNELLQQSARKAGFDLSFEVVEYSQIAAAYSNPNSREMRGVTAINKGFSTADLSWTFYNFYPPNVIDYDDPETTRLLHEYRTNFDPSRNEELLRRFHEHVVDAAPWAFIVHDVNPRAFSPKVKGYTPAQTWFTDLTTVHVEP